MKKNKYKILFFMTMFLFFLIFIDNKIFAFTETEQNYIDQVLNTEGRTVLGVYTQYQPEGSRRYDYYVFYVENTSTFYRQIDEDYIYFDSSTNTPYYHDNESNSDYEIISYHFYGENFPISRIERGGNIYSVLIAHIHEGQFSVYENFNDMPLYYGQDNVENENPTYYLSSYGSPYVNNEPIGERGTEQGGNGGDVTEPDDGDSGDNSDSDSDSGFIAWIKERFKDITTFFSDWLALFREGWADIKDNDDKNTQDTIDVLDSNTGEVVGELNTGFVDLHNGIASVADGIITFNDGLQLSLQEAQEQSEYYSSYANLDSESSKYTDTGANEAITSSVTDIRDKFGFATDVRNNVNGVINVIQQTQSSPTFSVYINSKYYTGTLNIVNLSWYAPYKELGDNVICIFCYIAFLWEVFKRLPNIINGTGAESFSAMKVENERNETKAFFNAHSLKLK